MTSVDPRIAGFYSEYDEAARLHSTATGSLELERTRELLRRYLPPPPARVLDVRRRRPGCTCSVADRGGYGVHLVDPVQKHVEQARERAPGCVATQGDTRQLDFSARSFDVVLLLGSLYHLAERADRLRALREARRVAVQGGVVAAAGISRFP